MAVVLSLASAWVLAAADPCSGEAKVEIERSNRISKPAHGGLEELPPGLSPSLPAPERLKAIDNPLYHADQCRAVLGELPHIDCRDGFLVPIHQNGKLVTYQHGVLAIGGVPADKSVPLTCDEPAMLPYLNILPRHLGPVSNRFSAGCMLNTRMGHYRIGNVDWVFNCHYRPGFHEPNDPYDFMAVIGSNSVTGETCFFGHDQFKMSSTVAPIPGGTGPDDSAGRAEAARFWNIPSRNTCLKCHSGNKAWALTPHVNQSRLGGDGTMDFIPSTPSSRRRHPGWGYRLIGTVHNQVMVRPKAVWPANDDGTPDTTCTRCHVLTDVEEFLRLSRDSVGLPDLPKFTERSQGFPHFRQIWMPLGIDAVHDATEPFQEAVGRLERAIANPAYRARPEEEILSPCPPPNRIDEAAVTVTVNGDSEELQWAYRNDYGGVPTRDDIRFELSVQGSDGTSCRFRDVAPESLGSDRWNFRLPVRAGTTYTYRLKPYRYCFDRTVFSFSNQAVVTAAPKAPRADAGTFHALNDPGNIRKKETK